MDNREYDLDMWKKVVKKVVNAKTKTSLQLSSETRKINPRCPKSYRLTKKNKFSQNYWDDKTKSSHNSPPANASQPQSQILTQT